MVRGVRGAFLLGGVMVLVGGGVSARAASGTSPPPTLPCTEAAVQQALNAGGTYNVPCNNLGLTKPLVMSHGTVTLTGGAFLKGGLSTRIFIVKGGDLTLDGITMWQGGASAVGGSKGEDGPAQTVPGANGMDGNGAGSNGGNGMPGLTGIAGHNGTAAHVDTSNPASGAERGGCMTIAPGATVSMYGGGAQSCEVFGSSSALKGGAPDGGNGGNASRGGNGGAGGTAQGTATGPGGNGGNGGAGGNGGTGGSGANGLSAEGGAIYNQGTLIIVGGQFADDRALAGNGGTGGNGGGGGNGGSGGARGLGVGGFPDGSYGAGGNGGSAGAGGDGGAGGDAYGGAIYNDGGTLLVSGTEFDRNSVQPGLPGDLGQQSSSGEAGSYGSGVPNGSDGATSSGGDAGAAGSGAGGAIYSTDTLSLSGVTFGAQGANSLGPCQCSTYTMQNNEFGGTTGRPGSIGHESDPDYFGSEVCLVPKEAADARARRARNSTSGPMTTPPCRLIFPTARGASEYQPWARAIGLGSGNLVRVDYRGVRGSVVFPSIRVRVPGYTVLGPVFQHNLNRSAYDCASVAPTFDTLGCTVAAGEVGANSGYFVFEVEDRSPGPPTSAQVTALDKNGTAMGQPVTVSISPEPICSPFYLQFAPEFCPPEYRKQDTKHAAIRSAVNGYRDALGDCGLDMFPQAKFVFVLGLGLGLDCAAAERQTAINETIRSDPPDHRFREVVLPQPITAPPAHNRCRRLGGRRARRCLAVAVALQRNTAAELNLGSVLQAEYVALNRLNTAAAGGDLQDEGRQGWALGVLLAEDTQATVALNSASKLLANALTRAHMNVLLSAKQVAQDARLLARGKLPRAITDRLAGWGIGVGEVRQAMQRGRSDLHPGPLSAVRALRAALPTAPRPIIDAGGVASLVQGLANAGSIASAQKKQFDQDLVAYVDGQDDPSKLAALRTDASSLGGQASLFMLEALSELR